MNIYKFNKHQQHRRHDLKYIMVKNPKNKELREVLQ
jgi:hypothetical protein